MEDSNDLLKDLLKKRCRRLEYVVYPQDQSVFDPVTVRHDYTHLMVWVCSWFVDRDFVKQNTGIRKKQDVNGNSLIKPILKRSSDADNVKSAGVESEFEVSLANLGSDVLPLVFATRALGIDPGVYHLVIGHDLKP
ncbi:hypothetical protein Tco_0347339 [Tanacetum coccineum]